MIKYFYMLLLMPLILFSCKINKSNEIESTKGIITENSVDNAKLGMSISELKKVYSDKRFTELPLFEYGIDGEDKGYLISEGNKPLMFIWTMQEDSVIAGIICLSDRFETINKLKVGLKINYITKTYPNLKLSRDCLNMESEYAFLDNIGVTIEFISSEKTRVGRYINNDCNEETNNLDVNRKIDRIIISSNQD